jgi:hypothetical protein
LIRFALVALLTFAALGSAFFLSSSQAQIDSASKPSKFDALFR